MTQQFAKDKYYDYDIDELYDKIDELELKIYNDKKQNKSLMKEKEQELENFRKQIEDFETEKASKEKADFLKDKNLSKEEQEKFEELTSKGYDKDDALLIATKNSDWVKKNQENIKGNSLDGNDDIASSKTITYEELANLDQDSYNAITAKIDKWEVKVK